MTSREGVLMALEKSTVNLSHSTLLVVLLAGVLSLRADDVLLQADFDRGSAVAGVAKGDPKPISGTLGEPLPAAGIGGQSVEVAAPGRQLAYRAPGNLDLNQGSLILWLQPLDWDRDTEGFTPLLSMGTEKGYAIHYFLYYHHFPGGDRNLDFRARIDGRELCITERDVVPKNPAVLSRGEWTQLGVTWSSNQFALFVNGEKVGEQTYGLPVTRGLPGPQEAIWIMPNPFWKEEPGPVRTTRVDEVSILARPLTPAEMRARFRQFRSAVAKRHQPAAAPVPRSAVPVRLDGQLEAAEWADASRVPIMKKLDGGRVTALRGWCSLKYDAQALLLAFAAETPHEVSCQGSGRDAAVFGGDEAEVILRPPWTPSGVHKTPADVFFQFAVNPAGAWAARRAQGVSVEPEIWAWQTGYQCAAQRQATGWTAEMRIPFADLGGVPEPGQPWLAEFGLHRPLAETLGGDYERWLAWSATVVSERSGFDDPANMGLLHFQPAGLAVRLEQLGDLGSGQALLGLSVLQGASLQATLVVTGETAELGSWSWAAAAAVPSFSLPPPGEGFLDLTLRAPDGPDPLYRFNTALWVKQPLALSTKSHAATGELAVHVDLSGAQDEVLTRSLREHSARLTLSLTDRVAATPRVSATFTPVAAAEEFRLRLGELPVGTYDLEARVTGGAMPLAARLPFERPSPAFLSAGAGIDRSIPAPWVPIRVDGATVAVLNRTYGFSGQPFPAAASSAGQSVLARQVTLAVERGGQILPFPAGTEEVVEAAPDRLISAGSATLSDGSLRLDWRRTVAFDGLVTCELNLVPATAGAKVRVDAFWLEAAVPMTAARFVFPYNADWPKLGKVAARRDWAWVTNDRVGLCWFTDRDANWVWADAASPVAVIRRGDEAVIRAQIIGKPVDIASPTPYLMGLTATPTRPLRPDWRRVHAEGWRAPRGETLQSVCWMDVEGIQFTNRWLLGDLVEPEKGLKELAEYKALGIDCVPYACGSAMPTNNPIYDFYESQWEITSNGRPAPKDYRTVWRGREVYIGSVCPASGFADWMTFATRNYMTKYPFAGLYLDYGCPSACDNPRHGCGVIDVFGQSRGSFGILAKRAMYQRLYTIIHGLRPEGYLWTHNWLAFCPPVHSFTDLDFPGEEFMHTAPRNPNVYTDAVSADEWQCNYNSQIRGVGIQFLSMVANSLEEMRDEARRSRPLLTALLLHDVPCNGNRIHWETISRVWKALDTNNVTAARFTGYWDPAARVTSSEPRLRVSAYSWADEKRLLLVVGNLSDAAASGQLDLKAVLGAGVAPTATDAETGESVDLQKPINLIDRDFRLLSVVW